MHHPYCRGFGLLVVAVRRRRLIHTVVVEEFHWSLPSLFAISSAILENKRSFMMVRVVLDDVADREFERQVDGRNDSGALRLE